MYLAVRLKEHKRSVFNDDRRASALAEHAIDPGHTIDWENASVLGLCRGVDTNQNVGGL